MPLTIVSPGRTFLTPVTPCQDPANIASTRPSASIGPRICPSTRSVFAAATTVGAPGLADDRRSAALARFQIIRPHLEEGVPLARIAQERHLSPRTLSRWAAHYRRIGLPGLCRKSRNDWDKRKMSPILRKFIEGLALHRPHLSAAGVHREATLIAARPGEPAPSYRTVHTEVSRHP